MFTIQKTFSVSAAHSLGHLNYASPCKRTHGHNWKITVSCRATKLDANGMVIDFSKLKKLIHGKMDHRYLPSVKGLEISTAERIAFWILSQINIKYRKNNSSPECYKVEVEESEGSVATYEI